MNLKLDIFNYPFCEIGFVSHLSEDVYRIIGDKAFLILTGRFRNSVNTKNANIKNISPESIPS